MFKRAFTLTELLIALAIIGILSAVLYPIIVHILPDRNVVMAKRAFYTTETIVADMINNRYCYPDLTSNKTDPRVGFDDGSGYSRCVYGRTQENDALKKFATLFTDKLDIKTISDDKQSFTTKDGLVWTITSPTETENILNFQNTKNKKLAHIIITVDTNGSKKDPNCGQSSYSPACSSSNKKSYDKFSMRVFATGKIQVLDCWAVKAIQVSKDLNNKNSTGNEKDTGAICAELGEPEPEPAVCNVEPSVYTDVCCEDEKWSSSANCQVPEENDCDCSLHPNGPSDDCCNPEKCPHSEWTETAYCGNCYPLDTSSASSCCNTWYANPSIFGNFGSKDEDEKTQACCNVSSFSSSHSSEGDVCYVKSVTPESTSGDGLCFPDENFSGLDCSSTYSYEYCRNLYIEWGGAIHDVSDLDEEYHDQYYSVYLPAVKKCCTCGGFKNKRNEYFAWGDDYTFCSDYDSKYSKLPICECSSRGDMCKADVTFNYEISNIQQLETYSYNLCAGTYTIKYNVVANACNNQTYKFVLTVPDGLCGQDYRTGCADQGNFTCYQLIDMRPKNGWFYFDPLNKQYGCTTYHDYYVTLRGSVNGDSYSLNPMPFIGDLQNGQCVPRTPNLQIYDEHGDLVQTYPGYSCSGTTCTLKYCTNM